jgi:hypothetical protein
MPCGLFFNRIRARLQARKRLREESQNGANDSNSTKKSNGRTPVSGMDKVRASILGERLDRQIKPANLGCTHNDKLVKAFSIPRRGPGMSAPSRATLSNTPANLRSQRASEKPIDPAKSYLMGLPRELKLEIIDHLGIQSTGFVNDPTKLAFLKPLDLHNLRLSVHVH